MRLGEYSSLSEKDILKLQKLAEQVRNSSNIEQELYQKFNVKRGLRNANGTGVLVGLTEVGEVRAYIMDENEKVPIDGHLMYRGIDVNDLVAGFTSDNRFGFEECCYLLLLGELPNRDQLNQFKELLGENRRLPEGFLRDMILKAPSKDIMNKLARCVLSCYSYDDNSDEISIANVVRQSIALISYMPTFTAYGYQALSHYHNNDSLYIHSPEPEFSTAENLLHMIRPDGEFTKLEAEVLDLALVLHAEHGGGNNSSFTTHVVTSSGTDTYSAIAAAIGSLKGPKHGGASLKTMEMMKDIKENIHDWEDDEEVSNYILKLFNKQAFDKTGLVYGLGHAVYTLSDPRAVLLKKKAQELAKDKDMNKEMNLYLNIEKLAPKVFEKFKGNDKHLGANVDFYSGFVYKMLDIPEALYTPIFACSRIAGWCAHRLEELINGGRIIRPAYKSVSKRLRYTPIDKR